MFEEPNYLIQFGYNGQTIVRRALENGHTDGVILSPTDYGRKDNINLAEEVNQAGKTVLFDPQYYIPRTERKAAQSYPYFKTKGGDEFETVVVQRGPKRRELCEEIIEVQDEMDVDAYITPARHIDALVDRKLNEWKELTQTFLEVAEEVGRDIPIFASVPVDGDVIRHPDDRNEFLDFITGRKPDGFYVSIEYDRDHRYPLTGSQDVHAYLDLMKSLKLNQFEVIAGHTHQIAHLLLAIGVDAFGSGHYKNTKAFDVGRWVPDEDGFGRTVIYYYSDPVLNDIRVEQGLQRLYTSGFDISRLRNGSPYEKDLFGAVSPDSADWKLSEAAWDHYIWSCHQIAKRYRGLTFDERVEEAKTHVEDASDIYQDMLSHVSEDELETIERGVFNEWKPVFKSIAESINNPIKKRMLQGM
jgi:hypothetical protein